MSDTVARHPVRVMIVDDSVVVRGLLRNIIEKHKDLEIVATSVDGEAALQDYKTYLPDIVLLDIEMPHMDGLSALRALLKMTPPARVIMCSSLTQSGAAATCRALEEGALDCLAKPTSRSIDRGQDFERELVGKLRSLGRSTEALRVHTSLPENMAGHIPSTSSGASFRLRPFPDSLPRHFPLALAIGSSTGGPRALSEVLAAIDPRLMLPVFITQHIPAGFAGYLAVSLQKNTGLAVHEAKEGMAVEPGHVYIAPGERHMSVRKGTPRRIELHDTPPVNFCKPSIDVMLDGLAAAYGGSILTVLLTGMGSDGRDACRRLVTGHADNILIAQDEATSVIWGIPGAAARDNLCHAVLPLAEIGPAINRLLRQETISEGERHADRSG